MRTNKNCKGWGMNTFIRTMILATAVLLAPVAEAATVKAKAPVVKMQAAKPAKSVHAGKTAKVAKARKASRKAQPLRGYIYRPQLGAAVMLPAPAIAAAQPARLPKPPPAPAIAQAQPAVEGEVSRISALMHQCHAAMPAAHPWRAAQAQREMFQLKVSMSYRAAADRLSEQEKASAAAIEARAYGNLAATCAPLLV